MSEGWLSHNPSQWNKGQNGISSVWSLLKCCGWTTSPTAIWTAITEPHAHLDIAANGVWGGRFERSYFDFHVFNPYVPSNLEPSLKDTYKIYENEKIRHYNQRIREVKQSSFVPLVFSATGWMASICSSFYKHIVSLISEKRPLFWNNETHPLSAQFCSYSFLYYVYSWLSLF